MYELAEERVRRRRAGGAVRAGDRDGDASGGSAGRPRGEGGGFDWTRGDDGEGGEEDGAPAVELSYDYGDGQERLTLEPGARIAHPHFGEGTVVATSGSGRSTKAEIDFDAAGTKKVMVAHADLRPA